jgi:hypothetical protein
MMSGKGEAGEYLCGYPKSLDRLGVSSSVVPSIIAYAPYLPS